MVNPPRLPVSTPIAAPQRSNPELGMRTNKRVDWACRRGAVIPKHAAGCTTNPPGVWSNAPGVWLSLIHI
eukprot:6677326-Pyramimonas_sp.AAC.1